MLVLLPVLSLAGVFFLLLKKILCVANFLFEIALEAAGFGGIACVFLVANAASFPLAFVGSLPASASAFPLPFVSCRPR